MRIVSTTTRFERRLKVFSRLHPELIKKIEFIMASLSLGKSSSFKVHKLKGKLKDCFSASITRAHRIVFILSINNICFIDIGDHDDVYK